MSAQKPRVNLDVDALVVLAPEHPRTDRAPAGARALGAAAFALLVGAGCGASLSATRIAANSADDLQKALTLAGAPKHGPVNAIGKPIAFLVAASPRALVAFDLAERKILWTRPADVTSRLAVGPRGVYGRVGDPAKGAGAVAGWDAADGRPLFTAGLPAGRQLLGLAADAAHVYAVTVGEEHGRRVSHLTAMDAATGAQAWDLAEPGTMGAPAARGGVVVLPYLSQYLSMIDAARGAEIARIRVGDEEVSFVRSLPEGVFYGSTGVFTLNDRATAGTKQGSTYVEATLPPFVRPVYALDGYDPLELDYSAYDRNRLLWRGAGGDEAGFVGGTVVVHNYRYLFGFDAAKGELRWAYSQPRNDLVSAFDAGRAVVFASSEGELGAIDVATGAAEPLGGIGQRTLGATFDADGLRVAGAGAQPSLEKALADIIWDPDARFTSVKLFAIDAMGKIPGKEVSADLLKIVQNPKAARPIYDRAGAALVAREDREALALYLQALAVRRDYVEDTQPRAVDVLARAVAALAAKQAAPDLVAQLEDPAATSAQVAVLAEALTQMEAREAVPVFRSYLLQYRADPLFQNDPGPLAAVADGLLTLGGPLDRALLRYVAEDPRTLGKLRAYIAKALAAGSASTAVAAPTPSVRAGT